MGITLEEIRSLSAGDTVLIHEQPRQIIDVVFEARNEVVVSWEFSFIQQRFHTRISPFTDHSLVAKADYDQYRAADRQSDSYFVKHVQRSFVDNFPEPPEHDYEF